MNPSLHPLHLPADAAIDLHLHTTFSDGRWQAEELIAHLASQGFGLIAITDHDRTDCLPILQQLAAARRLPLLTGVEMTTTWQGEFVDLLCYGVTPGPGELSRLCDQVLQRQQENTRQVFNHLLAQGQTLPPAALAELLTLPVARQPHAFLPLLTETDPGLDPASAGRMLHQAGLKMETSNPAEVASAAHRNGAVCLLAHPGNGDGYITFDPARLDEFRRQVPIDGLEADHPVHPPAAAVMYREYAEHHHLLISAGSDSHSPQKPPHPYPAGTCRQLLEWAGIRVD